MHKLKQVMNHHNDNIIDLINVIGQAFPHLYGDLVALGDRINDNHEALLKEINHYQLSGHRAYRRCREHEHLDGGLYHDLTSEELRDDQATEFDVDNLHHWYLRYLRELGGESAQALNAAIANAPPLPDDNNEITSGFYRTTVKGGVAFFVRLTGADRVIHLLGFDANGVHQQPVTLNTYLPWESEWIIHRNFQCLKRSAVLERVYSELRVALPEVHTLRVNTVTYVDIQLLIEQLPTSMKPSVRITTPRGIRKDYQVVALKDGDIQFQITRVPGQSPFMHQPNYITSQKWSEMPPLLQVDIYQKLKALTDERKA